MRDVAALAATRRGICESLGPGLAVRMGTALRHLEEAERALRCSAGPGGGAAKDAASALLAAAACCRAAVAAFRARAGEGRRPEAPPLGRQVMAAFVLLGLLVTDRVQRPCTQPPYTALLHLRGLVRLTPEASLAAAGAQVELAARRNRADPACLSAFRAALVAELPALGQALSAGVACEILRGGDGECPAVRAETLRVAALLFSEQQVSILLRSLPHELGRPRLPKPLMGRGPLRRLVAATGDDDRRDD